ncbi:MAG: transposase [Candidatus Omnitrophica bacterium]|nr:transposase [Candidatus Omnitrophota bacterium]
MARPYRLQAENCFYHITCRGDDRKRIFLNETDYEKFLKYLKSAKEKFKFYLYAYCLMGNHYHLLLEITQANLSRIMQYINTAYTIYYNVKYKRCGHLFQGRFKSILVEADSYFAELTRYIHLNPVKAKIVGSPGKYRWSSYNSYINNKADDFLDKERVQELLVMDISKYRQFVLEEIKNPQDIFKNVYAGFILGGTRFVKDKLNQLQIEIESKDFAHKRAVKNIIDPQEIINAVAYHFKLDPEQMCKSNKRPMIAKKIALYLLRHKTGLTNAQIGKLFDMKLAAVSKAVLSFEREMKKDKGLNKAIGQITSKIEI